MSDTSQAPPTFDEISYIQKFMSKNLVGDKLVSKDVVKLADTRLEKVQMMHCQDRNVHEKFLEGI
jgi:hypothetical protein